MTKNKMFVCRYPGCGAVYKSASGRNYHEKHLHGNLYSNFLKKSEQINPTNNELNSKDEQIISDKNNQENIDKEDIDNNQVKINEVNFDMAKEKLNKAKENEEMSYECGECGEEFNTKSKFCPNCGIRFQ